MAEIGIARTGQFMRKLFEILQPLPDGLPAREALQRLQSAFVLSDYERGNNPSGANRFEKTVRFATVDAVKAGWLTKNKGVWSITEDGRAAYRKYTDPEAFFREASRLYHVWRQAQPGVVEPATEQTDEQPEDGKDVRITFEQAEEQAWAEIESYLRGISPYDFQELVAALLKAMGYHIDWIAPPGRDGGTDIVAHRDPLGTLTPRIKVQVRRIGQNVDVNDLRQYMAVLGDDDVGLFVTTSGFTKTARDEARQHRRKVTLVDLERFFDLWVEHYPKLDDAARRRFPLQPIYFLAPGN
jgi:restriction system protein